MLSELWLTGDGASEDAARVRQEFPTVRIRTTPDTERAATIVYAAAWHRAPWDPSAFDDVVIPALAGGIPLCIARDPFEHDTTWQVLTRYQRCLEWQTGATRHPRWADVLHAHRGLHDFGQPQVRAHYDHALDAWAWMLRLDPEASLEAQLAILFHGIDRHVHEADHVLASCGIAPRTRTRVADLMARHESPPHDGCTAVDASDASLVGDADALSFFSLNSAGYLRAFGPEETRRQVRRSFRRLTPRRRARLRRMRLTEEVSALLRHEESDEERGAEESLSSRSSSSWPGRGA